ncbi:hypothetical protein NDU88_003564 [Pleurodeles waltl]|uniref:Uncharacterized protein n=1 Tax=Pleurodeles waltl TaxID=8319 RepID=A0AAV7MQX1_PLEWA|nr:hypothetical protein NDU88_003564 [Pleurodeles waltl]
MGETRPLPPLQHPTKMDQYTISTPAVDDTAGVAGSSLGPSAPHPDLTEKCTSWTLEPKGDEVLETQARSWKEGFCSRKLQADGGERNGHLETSLWREVLTETVVDAVVVATPALFGSTEAMLVPSD